MQEISQIIQKYLVQNDFGKEQEHCFSSKRVLVTSKALFILQKTTFNNYMIPKIHSFVFKTQHFTSRKIQLFDNNNNMIDFPYQEHQVWNIELLKHPISQLICIALHKVSSVSDNLHASLIKDEDKSYVFVSYFQDEFKFPETFYNIQIEAKKIIDVKFVSESKYELGILYDNNNLVVYDVWSSLNKPLKSITLYKNQDKNDRVVSITLNNSELSSGYLFVTAKGQIRSPTYDNAKLKSKFQQNNNSKLLFCFSQCDSKSQNKINKNLLSFTIQFQTFYMYSQLEQKQLSLKLFIQINKNFGLVYSQQLQHNTLSQKQIQMLDNCSDVIWSDSQAAIILLFNYIFLVRINCSEKNKLQVKMQLLAQVKDFNKTIFVSFILGKLLFIIVSQSIEIKMIPIKERYQLLNNGLSSKSIYQTQKSKILNDKLSRIRNLKQEINYKISSVGSKQQLSHQMMALLQKSRAQFKSYANLGSKIALKQREKSKGANLKQSSIITDQINIKQQNISNLNLALNKINRLKIVDKIRSKIKKQLKEIVESMKHMDEQFLQNSDIKQMIIDILNQNKQRIGDVLT